VRRFSRERTTLFLDPEAEPLAEIAAGERILVETADSLCGLAKARAPRGMDIDDVVEELGGACPLTGPFFVAGAAVGGVLEVEIHRVDVVGDEAWTGIFGGFGALGDVAEPETRVAPHGGGIARFPCRGAHVDVPLAPFLGTVGVAPRRERRLTFSQSPEYLGDVDVPALAAGATLVLPVNVEGALIAFGDVHAAQGAGEITGAALEVEAEVELTLRPGERHEAGFAALPQINTAQAIGSVAGYQGLPLGECARAAYRDLLDRLVRFHGYSPAEAYELLSVAGQLDVGNMIDPFYSVMASLDRRYL
jgi:acetamidase/formamidase